MSGRGYKRYKGHGKRVEVGTKLYPYQIAAIDRTAKYMGMTRYALIRKILLEALHIAEPRK